jgi:ABC-type polysaccharide/polyol phosphate export permease
MTTLEISNSVDIVRQRSTLALYLARMEFARRFSGTVGGAIWMFVGPLATILTIWFALEFGLASSARFGGGFGPSLAVGLCAWLFFVDAVLNATSSITSNPHLVKKVVFPVWVLPLAAILSSFVVHCAVLCVVLAVLSVAGLGSSVNLVALPFWMLCLLMFATAVGLAVATLNVRYREASVVTPNILSLVFWLTPIVWPPDMLPEHLKGAFLSNPMATIIEGYRRSVGLTDRTSTSGEAAQFVLIAVLVIAFALRSYRRQRPHFADSL